MKAMLAVKADNAIHSSSTSTGTSPADNSSTPKAPEKETKWAVVKGSQTVRIYYTPDHTDKGEIPFFTISYWMHGKRSRHVFPTLKAAKKAEELDRGDHGAAKLTNESVNRTACDIPPKSLTIPSTLVPRLAMPMNWSIGPNFGKADLLSRSGHLKKSEDFPLLSRINLRT